MKKFLKPGELPFVNPENNIPPEVTMEMDMKSKRDTAIVGMKSKKILKQLMKKGTNMYKVHNCLSDYFKETLGQQPISIEKISKITRLSINCIPSILSSLSGLDGYQYRIISARDADHKRTPGYVQLSTKNTDDTYRWLMTRTRSMAWQQQRMDMTEQSVMVKRMAKKLMVKNEDKKKILAD